MKFKPLTIALLTFLVGFGVLSVFYWIMIIMGVPAAKLRGLYDFHAVIGGDAFIVPILISVIVASYKIKTKLFDQAKPDLVPDISKIYSHRVWNILTIILAGIVVLIFHIMVVYGNERNWTLPVYGQLNLPGWYHGIFMFVLFYIVFGYCINQVVTLFLVWKYGPQLGDIKKPWAKNMQFLICVILLIGCFGGLLASDRIASDYSWLTSVSIVFKEATVLSIYFVGLPIYLMTLSVDRKLGRQFHWFQSLISLFLIVTSPTITIIVVYLLEKI